MFAELAELAGAQASGACGSNTVRVQVPSLHKSLDDIKAFVVTKHPQEAAGDRFFRCNLKCRFEYTANYLGKSFADKPGKVLGDLEFPDIFSNAGTGMCLRGYLSMDANMHRLQEGM